MRQESGGSSLPAYCVVLARNRPVHTRKRDAQNLPVTAAVRLSSFRWKQGPHAEEHACEPSLMARATTIGYWHPLGHAAAARAAAAPDIAYRSSLATIVDIVDIA